jgi:hypothetical protein
MHSYMTETGSPKSYSPSPAAQPNAATGSTDLTANQGNDEAIPAQHFVPSISSQQVTNTAAGNNAKAEDSRSTTPECSLAEGSKLTVRTDESATDESADTPGKSTTDEVERIKPEGQVGQVTSPGDSTPQPSSKRKAASPQSDSDVVAPPASKVRIVVRTATARRFSAIRQGINFS